MLRSCLWMTRFHKGNLLLPLILENIVAQRREARTDALALLADCLIGVPHATSFFFDFLINLQVPCNPIPMSFVHVHLFDLCNIVKQLVSKLRYHLTTILSKLNFQFLIGKSSIMPVLYITVIV